MKVRYIGPSFGVDGLFDGHIYEVLGVCDVTGALRVVDESGEDYLYSPTRPGPAFAEYPGGHFEIVEDDAAGTLRKAIKN